MSKYKPGLHKDVSAIFNGASLAKNDVTKQSSAAPEPGQQNQSAPKPPAPVPASQKPPAPSHMTPTKPKAEQSPSQTSKAAPTKRPKARTVKKAEGKAQWQRKLEHIQSKLFATEPGENATKQKVMVILIPVLFIALIFLFIRAFGTPSRKIAGSGTLGGPVKTAAAASDGKLEWKVPEPYPTTLRDPMQFGPARNQEGQVDNLGLIVKGIVHSRNNPCAVVSDQIVHQGDKVLGVVIVKINEDSVEFEVNGNKWTQKVQR